MTIQENISLKPFNTFGINANARFFCEITSLEELREALSLDGYPEKIILSGGSNMLITQDLDALVLYIHIKGIEIEQEGTYHVLIKVMAGENWHEMVLWTLDHNYGGLENLSLIPGFTGTAPIQNIGAYGVELKDCFISCEAMDTDTLELKTFTKDQCKFGYRDSYFKNEGKGKYIITSVKFKLTTKDHRLNTSYGAIETEMEQQQVVNPTIKDVSNAVVAIRKSKLPDPKELGNSGSFFKNPVLTKKEFDLFIKHNPEAHYYKVSDKEYKVPAGWLIEQSGFKGKRFGDAGVHKNQALVLVNYGNASGKEIIELAQTIQKKIWDNFQIEIVPEVNIINNPR